jgi:hypothetical protein
MWYRVECSGWLTTNLDLVPPASGHLIRLSTVAESAVSNKSSAFKMRTEEEEEVVDEAAIGRRGGEDADGWHGEDVVASCWRRGGEGRDQ